jgi:hypothetical protein
MPTLSDDEFIAQAPAKLIELEKAVAAVSPSETPPVVNTPPVVETPPAADTPPASSDNSDAAAVIPPTETPPGSPGEPAAKTVEGDAEAAAVGAAEGGEAAEEPDYKAVYERLFGKPIRASGQDIQLHNTDEVISLVQKGVGFHTKMNRLHGDLKYVEMLRNNGLLDEQKLSLLIDAQAGKPGAIKKLLDSAKVDPLTLDSTEASTYAPSDHRVSDEQMNFQSVVADLSSSETGKALLIDAQGWDQSSKAEIYKTPAVLAVLAEQKEMGRYDLIVAEVNRAKVLGQLPPGEGFIQSYTRVGQQMMQAGKFGSPPPSTPTPVAQKTVTPPVPANSKKAAAAAPTRASAPGAQPVVDIKEMDDATFETHFRKTLKI